MRFYTFKIRWNHSCPVLLVSNTPKDKPSLPLFLWVFLYVHLISILVRLVHAHIYSNGFFHIAFHYHHVRIRMCACVFYLNSFESRMAVRSIAEYVEPQFGLNGKERWWWWWRRWWGWLISSGIVSNSNASEPLFIPPMKEKVYKK